jgi:hypothetical protein
LKTQRARSARNSSSIFGARPRRTTSSLNAQGEALLASIDRGYRPEALDELFPRIVNRMAKLWKQPGQMERYFEDLLIDHRGNRKGFPLKVLMDLSTLKDYYQRSAFATTRAGARQAVTNTAR